MKNFLKSLLIVIIIFAVTAVLVALGIQMDMKMWADKPADVLGHPAPAYTILLPGLWLGLIFFIVLVQTVIRWIRAIADAIRNRK